MIRTAVLFLVSGIFLLQSLAFASFDEDARRYLSGEEILWSLSTFFDFTQNPHNKDLCSSINSQNSSFSGSDSPSTGDPTSPAPSEGTVLWITGCIEDFLSSSQYISQDPVRLKTLVGDDALAVLGRDPASGLMQPWSSWTLDHKKALVQYMMLTILGPDDVILDFGFIQDVNAFRTELLAAADSRHDASVLQIVTLLAENLCVRDEFLSY